jgi:hypothetical protein
MVDCSYLVRSVLMWDGRGCKDKQLNILFIKGPRKNRLTALVNKMIYALFGNLLFFHYYINSYTIKWIKSLK